MSKVEELKTLLKNNIKNACSKAGDTNVVTTDALLKRLEKTSSASFISFKEEILAAIAIESSTTSKTATKNNKKCDDVESESAQEYQDFRTSEVLAMKLAEVLSYIMNCIQLTLLLYRSASY